MKTLGQVTAGADNLGLIQRVYDALNSGGRFLVEVPQRDSTVNSLIEADTFRLKGQITEVRREYDEMSKSITETFDIVTTAESRRYILRYSLFDWPELSALFEGGGFKVLEAFADSNGTPLLPESINMWCVGRK